MPFASERQRRYLHVHHPDIAMRWEREGKRKRSRARGDKVKVRKYDESQHPRDPHTGEWISGRGTAHGSSEFISVPPFGIEAVPIDRGPGPVMTIAEAHAWAKNSKLKGSYYHGGTGKSGLGARIWEGARGGDLGGRGYYVADRPKGADMYGKKDGTPGVTREVILNVDKPLYGSSDEWQEIRQSDEVKKLQQDNPGLDQNTAIQVVAQRQGYDALVLGRAFGRDRDIQQVVSVWDARKVAIVTENVRKYSPRQPRDDRGRWRGAGDVLNPAASAKLEEPLRWPGEVDSLNDRQQAMEKLARKRGQSVEKFRASEDKHVQSLLDKAAVTVQVPGRVLEKLLDGQELKTNSRGGSGTSYTSAHYRDVESHFFADSKPIYGAMRENPSNAGLGSSLLNYGAYELVLSDDVRPYTTVTMGDSMDLALDTSDWGPNQTAKDALVAPVPLEGSAHASDAYPYASTSGAASRIKSVDQLPDQMGYVEAQIHQGIGMGDVQAIRVFRQRGEGTSHMPNEYPNPKGPRESWSYDDPMGLAERAESLGIPTHYVYIDSAGRVQNKEHDPLRKDYDPTQARDFHGRWTKLGGQAPVSIADLPDKARAGVEKWVAKNNVDIDQMADRIVTALEDESARDQGEVWYEQEFQQKAQVLAKRYDRSVEEVTAVIAITSAQNPWTRGQGADKVYPNLETAERFLRAAQSGTFDGAKTLKERVDVQVGLGYMRDNGFGANVVGLLNGTLQVDEAVTGAKRRSFFNNGGAPEDSDDITNDVWMGQLMVASSDITEEQVQGMLSGKPPMYLSNAGVNASPAYVALSEAVLRATARGKANGTIPEGWKNHQTQAAAWVWLYENRPAGRGARI